VFIHEGYDSYKRWREFWFDYSIQTFCDHLPPLEEKGDELLRKESITLMVTENIDIAGFKMMRGSMAGYFNSNP